MVRRECFLERSYKELEVKDERNNVLDKEEQF